MFRLSDTNLFGALRRDRLLFAIVGALVLVLHMLQPLAAARAASVGLDVICSAFGDDDRANDATLPAGVDDCPQCVAGPCSGLSVADPSVGQPALAYPPIPVASPQVVVVSHPAVHRAESDPPPPLRGPPSLI